MMQFLLIGLYTLVWFTLLVLITTSIFRKVRWKRLEQLLLDGLLSQIAAFDSVDFLNEHRLKIKAALKAKAEEDRDFIFNFFKNILKEISEELFEIPKPPGS